MSLIPTGKIFGIMELTPRIFFDVTNYENKGQRATAVTELWVQ